MNLRWLLFITLKVYSMYGLLYAQDISKPDSLGQEKRNLMQKIYDYFDDSNEEDINKQFDMSFIGGPYYASETKFGVGLVASGLYRTDMTDTDLSPSNVAIYSNFSTSGFYGIGVRNNTIFPRGEYRIDGDVGFSSLPTRYYGIGYNAGKQKGYSKYTLRDIYINGNFMKRFANNVYAGLAVSFQRLKAKDFKDLSYLENDYMRTTAMGLGTVISYDSRDFIPNPSRGLYLKAEHVYYSRNLGSTTSFDRTEIAFRYYHPAWKDATLAFDFQGIFNTGNVPWNMLALMGNTNRMRGYYEGRYRDKKLLQGQVELRQKITGRHGAAVWAGAGNVFPRMSSLKGSQTLPNFGLGYRWEFKKRVNVRLDYGFGRSQSSFYFNINEAF